MICAHRGCNYDAKDAADLVEHSVTAHGDESGGKPIKENKKLQGRKPTPPVKPTPSRKRPAK